VRRIFDRLEQDERHPDAGGHVGHADRRSPLEALEVGVPDPLSAAPAR